MKISFSESKNHSYCSYLRFAICWVNRISVFFGTALFLSLSSGYGQCLVEEPVDTLNQLVRRALDFDVFESAPTPDAPTKLASAETVENEYVPGIVMPLDTVGATRAAAHLPQSNKKITASNSAGRSTLHARSVSILVNKKSDSTRPKSVQLGSKQIAEVADPRQQKIARCLAMYYRIVVDAKSWRPWTIMHALLPYEKLSKVKFNGELYSAVDYLCRNAIGNDTFMMFTQGSELGVSVGPGVQGHEGQFLAMLAQAGVSADQEIQINGQKFTVNDLVNYEKRSCQPDTELTFKLIGLSYYLDSDEIWTNSHGQNWNIERLIFEELKQPINGAACGGTHRLMGISFAINRREASGRKVDGQWLRAKNYIGQYQKYAFSFQNPDGSFSTNWFEGRDAEDDLKKRLYTTGHMVEWLSFSLPKDQLSNPALHRAVDYLLDLMLTAPAMDLEIGPKGHALHALRLFERRFYGENSNVEIINDTDLAAVERSLRMQTQMKPDFTSPISNPYQEVSFPQNSKFKNNIKTTTRRFRRRR